MKKLTFVRSAKLPNGASVRHETLSPQASLRLAMRIFERSASALIERKRVEADAMEPKDGEAHPWVSLDLKFEEAEGLAEAALDAVSAFDSALMRYTRDEDEPPAKT